MTAKEMIELYINSVGGSSDDKLNPADPESMFKRQLTKGKPYKKDAIRQYVARDLAFNVDTDNSWRSSADKPWF